ncbi:MAG TPA: helix-turn-helix transcriptional regulator [Thermoleophilaceae bacterium]
MRSIHDPRYLELIAALRAERTRRGLTQSEVAARLGRSQSFVAKTERGERRLDLVETLDLCTALGTTLDAVIPRGFARLLRDADGQPQVPRRRIA